MTAPSIPLKPLGPGEIIDEAIDLCRSNWRLFFGIAAVVEFPTTLLSRILFQGPHMYADYFWLPFVLVAPGYLAVVAVTAAASKRYLADEATLSDSYHHAMRRIRPLVATVVAALLVWIPTFIVLGCLAVPLMLAAGFMGRSSPHVLSPSASLVSMGMSAIGVVLAAFMGAWLALVYPAFVIEKRRGFGAVRRSWSLIRGSYWPAYVVVVLTELIAGAVAWGPTWIVQRIPAPAVVGVPLTAMTAALMAIVALPLRAVPRLILYFDLRVRKEGYDLQLLSQGDAPPPPLLQPQDVLPTVPDAPLGNEEKQNA